MDDDATAPQTFPSRQTARLQFGLQFTTVRCRPGKTDQRALVQLEPIRTDATRAANAGTPYSTEVQQRPRTAASSDDRQHTRLSWDDGQTPSGAASSGRRGRRFKSGPPPTQVRGSFLVMIVFLSHSEHASPDSIASSPTCGSTFAIANRSRRARNDLGRASGQGPVQGQAQTPALGPLRGASWVCPGLWPGRWAERPPLDTM